MSRLSTRVFEMEATYDEILQNVDKHEELKKMKACVIEQNVVFFIYRGCADTAVVLMNGENGFYASIQECTKLKQLKTNPDLLYALCYGV